MSIILTVAEEWTAVGICRYRLDSEKDRLLRKHMFKCCRRRIRGDRIQGRHLAPLARVLTATGAVTTHGQRLLG